MVSRPSRVPAVIQRNSSGQLRESPFALCNPPRPVRDLLGSMLVWWAVYLAGFAVYVLLTIDAFTIFKQYKQELP